MNIKEEYEALNGQIRYENYVFQSIEIDDSVIDSVNIKEAIDIYHTRSESILYFGAPWCPWCRNALPVLIDYAKDHNLRITYIDMDNKRPRYDYRDGEFIITDTGDKDYHLLIDEFSKIMMTGVAKLKDEIKEVPNTKNIPIPLVVFGSFGEIKGYHYGAVDLKEGQTAYDLLDQDQIKELYRIYEEKDVKQGVTCDETGCRIA